MKPLYVSVDLEFTAPNSFRGEIMQIGACVEPMPGDTRHEFGTTLPVSSEAETSEWVLDNQKELLHECWSLQAHYSNFRHTRRGHQPSSPFSDVLHSFRMWIIERQRHRALEDKVKPEQISGLMGIEWLREHYPAVFVGYCIGYDFAYLDVGFGSCDFQSPFHYKAIDIQPLAMGKLGLPWEFTQAELEIWLGVAPNEDKHNALADAKHQMVLFKKLMEMQKGG